MEAAAMGLVRGVLVLAGMAIALSAEVRGEDTTVHDLMPAPSHREWQTGRLRLDSRTSFGWEGTDEPDPRIPAALARARARLAAQIPPGLSPKVAGAKATVVVAAAGPSLPVQAVGEDESYELTVTPRQARIAAANPLGVMHGLETLLQLVRLEGGRVVVPAVKISDRPRFPWRGLLI